jgi:diketogulonate reductase-like aldo/keto reductase
LNFLTRHPNIFTIQKTSRPERAIENSDSVGWELNGEEILAIDLAYRLPDHDVPLEMI